MPKRKCSSNFQPGVEKPPTFRTALSPYLPQEILDRIIDFSIVTDVLLGPILEELHELFQSPFLEVNRACRSRVLSSVSSSKWIELSVWDSDHAHVLNFEFAHQFPMVYPVWVKNLLYTGKLSSVVIEFHSSSTSDFASPEDEFFGSYYIPYSYASMVRFISRIDSLHKSWQFGPISVRSERLAATQIRDIELILAFRLGHDTSCLDSDFNEPLERLPLETRNQEDPLSLIMARLAFMRKKLHETTTTDSKVRIMILLLYMNRGWERSVSDRVPGVDFWAETLNRPDWRSADTNTKKVLHVVWSLYELEAAAFRFFCELLKTDKEWTAREARYLTLGFSRWVIEHRSMYYAFPNIDLANFMHNAGEALGHYIKIINDTKVRPRLPYVETLSSKLLKMFQQRVFFFLTASLLNPENKSWRKDYLKAEKEIFAFYPDMVGMMKCHSEVKFTDVDGKKCTYHKTPVLDRDMVTLRYLRRAQTIIGDLKDEGMNSQVMRSTPSVT